MGELAVSGKLGDELVAIGLGSCIGLAMIDQLAGIAGLAHVVLPDSLGKAHATAKFADLAVPEMISRLTAAGALRRRMQAVLIGGASMFSATPMSLDIGARNIKAVLEALAQQGVPVIAQETGGTRGRTATVVVGQRITCRVAGEEAQTLLSFTQRRAPPQPSTAPLWAAGASA